MWMSEKDQGHKKEPSYQMDFWLLGCPASLSAMLYVKTSFDIGERLAWPRREGGKSSRGWSANSCRLVIDPGCTQSLYCQDFFHPSVVRDARHEHPPRLRRSSSQILLPLKPCLARPLTGRHRTTLRRV